jgi:vacuolar-type H+-ATPase subunit H
MDITNIIDRVEALVETSKRMPGTKARIVEEDKLLKLVEQLRLAIPQDMRAAQEVIEKKDSILAQAQIEARRIRNEAEDDYAAKLDQNEMLVTARRQSEDLLAEAEQKASRMVDHAEIESRRTRSDSDAYVIDSLKNLEREATQILGSVRKGIDSLSSAVHV